MQIVNEYDVAIIGGGLAGLSASILLAKAGYSVVLFEKEKYPFHKVCGEYVSMESREFLSGLGMPLQKMDLPVIDTLFLTSPYGRSFTTKLPLGGFGISRYQLDSMLADIAGKCGVHVLEQTKVDDARFDEHFELFFQSKKIKAKLCFASYGKRSNLDSKWKRNFLSAPEKNPGNYVGVKYHIKTQWKENVIGLHNFRNGYCGISKIEGDKYCLCYMTNAENLKKSNNNIEQLQEQILYQNPNLKKIFLESETCSGLPITISQISFSKKSQIQNHVLMLGDAAGMIAPLCGNGMSIALHTGKIAASVGKEFLSKKITRSQMEVFYQKEWEHHFAKRLKTGRIIQHFFGSNRLSHLFVSTFNLLPFLSKPLIRMTHGKPF